MAFRESLERGKIGEGIISGWLQSRGCAVMPAYQVEQGKFKGPQLFYAKAQFVSPDMLTFKNGKTCWIEAKTKSTFTWHRNSEKWVTGIDIHHYEQYLQVSSITHSPVWLLFWHPSEAPDAREVAQGAPEIAPKGLFGGDLAVLEWTESHRWNLYGKGGMVYWRAEDLMLIADADDVFAANHEGMRK